METTKLAQKTQPKVKFMPQRNVRLSTDSIQLSEAQVLDIDSLYPPMAVVPGFPFHNSVLENWPEIPYPPNRYEENVLQEEPTKNTTVNPLVNALSPDRRRSFNENRAKISATEKPNNIGQGNKEDGRQQTENSPSESSIPLWTRTQENSGRKRGEIQSVRKILAEDVSAKENVVIIEDSSDSLEGKLQSTQKGTKEVNSPKKASKKWLPPKTRSQKGTEPEIPEEEEELQIWSPPKTRSQRRVEHTALSHTSPNSEPTSKQEKRSEVEKSLTSPTRGRPKKVKRPISPKMSRPKEVQSNPAINQDESLSVPRKEKSAGTHQKTSSITLNSPRGLPSLPERQETSPVKQISKDNQGKPPNPRPLIPTRKSPQMDPPNNIGNSLQPQNPGKI